MTGAAQQAKPPERSEAEELFPERLVTVRDPDTGEDVDVRVTELNYLDSVKARRGTRELVDDVAAAVLEDRELTEVIELAVDRHFDAWLMLIALSTGHDEEWIGRLREQDGDAVARAMWACNGDFFFRLTARKVEMLRRSSTSSTASSPQGTGTTEQ